MNEISFEQKGLKKNLTGPVDKKSTIWNMTRREE